MVAGELFEVLVEKLVAGSDDEGCPELEGPPPGVVLHVSLDQSSRPGGELAGADQSDFAQGARPNQLGSSAVLVQKHLKRHGFIFYEGLGISPSPGTDCSHVRPGAEDLVVSLTDLTGPFPAGQSAEVAEEENNSGIGCPTVSEAVLVTFGIHEHHFGQGCYIEWHQVILGLPTGALEVRAGPPLAHRCQEVISKSGSSAGQNVTWKGMPDTSARCL